jgi:TonB family protein
MPGLTRAIAAFALALVVSAGSASGEDTSAIPQPDPGALEKRPNLQYPYEAKRQRITGSGVILVEIDSATGRVLGARMGVSTGSAILDNAATTAFRQARFEPGTASLVKIPIQFGLAGAGAVFPDYHVEAKNMDDVLARFLGKGTVLKGPIPEYPRRPAWTNKRGKGVYELHADKAGTVQQVRILKSSGDATFDRVVEKTLRNWRLRRGPLVLELPLSFVLTPTSYSVDVAR